MNILHVIANLDGYGLTRQLELLASSQVEAEHNVRVFALAAKRDCLTRLQQLGVEARALDRRWQRDPFVAVRLASELRRSAAEVVHAWDSTAQNYLSVIRRVPRLNALSAGTLVLAPRVAPGVALSKPARLSRRDFLEQQRLPAESILIAVAGPLVRDQQIDEAIWNFELVRTLDERARLLVFGDGPDRHRLERFARLTSEPSAIRFLGYRDDFRELAAYADLFWQTAATDEPLPLAMLEAMAARIPIVANDGPGCRRIITEGEEGYLVPDKDRAAYARQSRRVVEDPQLAEQLGNRAAQTIAERFSVAAMERAYSELYHNRGHVAAQRGF